MRDINLQTTTKGKLQIRLVLSILNWKAIVLVIDVMHITVIAKSTLSCYFPFTASLFCQVKSKTQQSKDLQIKEYYWDRTDPVWAYKQSHIQFTYFKSTKEAMWARLCYSNPVISTCTSTSTNHHHLVGKLKFTAKFLFLTSRSTRENNWSSVRWS